MNKATRKALEDSIAHWKRLLACETQDEAKEEDWNGQSCALCQMFPSSCVGCPVDDATQGNGCAEPSNWKAASSGLNNWCCDDGDKPTAEIQAQINFLESLK